MLLLELFAAPSTLYVNRPLIDADAFYAWVKQHFPKALRHSDYHVTIAHAKNHFDWSEFSPEKKDLVVNSGKRSVEALGDKGAVVLKIESPDLQKRWKAFCDGGANWDYEGYQPHVTITYDGADLNLDAIPPYRGPLKFGAEKFAPVTEFKPREQKT